MFGVRGFVASGLAFKFDPSDGEDDDNVYHDGDDDDNDNLILMTMMMVTIIAIMMMMMRILMMIMTTSSLSSEDIHDAMEQCHFHRRRRDTLDWLPRTFPTRLSHPLRPEGPVSKRTQKTEVVMYRPVCKGVCVYIYI